MIAAIGIRRCEWIQEKGTLVGAYRRQDCIGSDPAFGVPLVPYQSTGDGVVDPGELVGQCHGRDIRPAPCLHGQSPAGEPVGLALGMAQYGGWPVDEGVRRGSRVW